MAHLDAYLFFDGSCAAAMRFYETVLGARLEMMQTYAEAPATHSAKSSPSDADRIMHARLDVDGRALMGSDFPAGEPHPGMHGFALSINYPSVFEARQVFDALARGRVDHDAVWRDLLGGRIRHADRQVRHTVDGQRRQAEVISPGAMSCGGRSA